MERGIYMHRGRSRDFLVNKFTERSVGRRICLDERSQSACGGMIMHVRRAVQNALAPPIACQQWGVQPRDKTEQKFGKPQSRQLDVALKLN